MAPSSTTPNQPTIPVPSTLTLDSSTLPHNTHRALLLHLQQPPAATTTNPTPNPTISDLSTLLNSSLQSTGWPDRVRALALELLRSGTCSTFPELLAEVLSRARLPHPAPRDANGNLPASAAAEGSGVNGTKTKGTVMEKHNPTIVLPNAASYGPDGWPDVRIPLKTVEEGVEFLKGRVRDVVEVVESGVDAGEGGGESDGDE